MKADKVIRIVNYFNPQKKNISDKYITFNCPFAKVLHSSGRDNHPSFGISISNSFSVFHCFSCGVSGKLKYLPYKLEQYYNQSFKDLNDFIRDNENREDLLVEFNNNHSQNIINFDLDMFPYLDKWSFISPELLKYYNIRKNENDFIIPIYDLYNNLISVKIRNGSSYKTINSFSKNGVFFGMNKPLIKDKLLFIVEGERDLFALKMLGINNVWAILGRLTDEQIETLEILNMPLCLFFDNDTTGYSYTQKIINSNLNFPLFVVKNYFNCNDPAELFEKQLLKNALQTVKRLYLPQMKILLDKLV